MKKPTISLLNFFLITAMIAMGFGLAASISKGTRLQDENKAMKSMVGLLDIQDPSKVYVRSLDCFANNCWRFRIHWPEGYDGKFLVGKTVLLPNGEPDLESINVSSGKARTNVVRDQSGEHEEWFTFMDRDPVHLYFSQSIITDSGLASDSKFGAILSRKTFEPFLLRQPKNEARKFTIQQDSEGPHGPCLEFGVDEKIVLVQLESRPTVNEDGTAHPKEALVIALIPRKSK